MIHWNYMPYEGYFDANNHFINSFFGGLFYRLFNTEHIVVFRLGNLISFPVFYWSVAGFQRYFKSRINFFVMFTGLVFSSFLIEFFGMARGYGISMAFLMFAILMTFKFIEKSTFFRAIAIILSLVIATYSNLTLLPSAILIAVFVLIFGIKRSFGFWGLFLVPVYFPFYYAFKYSLDLSNGGKLYTGGVDGFISTTVASLAEYNWNSDHWIIIALLLIAFGFIIFKATYDVLVLKFFSEGIVFHLLLVSSVASIILMHFFLDVNYPDDRVALYLVPFFIGAFAFTIDAFGLEKHSVVFIALPVLLFVSDMNLRYFKGYDYDYFDVELLKKIPNETNGTPTTCAAYREFGMDDALSRKYDMPVLPFFELDTLSDYILLREHHLEEYDNNYEIVYKDEISGNYLMERRKKLRRKLLNRNNIQFETEGIFFDFLRDSLIGPSLIRCKGYFEDVTILDEIVLNFKTESGKGNVFFSEAVFLVSSCRIDEDQRIYFDFSVSLDKHPNAEIVKVFLHNSKEERIKGQLETSLYKLY